MITNQQSTRQGLKAYLNNKYNMLQIYKLLCYKFVDNHNSRRVLEKVE